MVPLQQAHVSASFGTTVAEGAPPACAGVRGSFCALLPDAADAAAVLACVSDLLVVPAAWPAVPACVDALPEPSVGSAAALLLAADVSGAVTSAVQMPGLGGCSTWISSSDSAWL